MASAAHSAIVARKSVYVVLMVSSSGAQRFSQARNFHLVDQRILLGGLVDRQLLHAVASREVLLEAEFAEALPDLRRTGQTVDLYVETVDDRLRRFFAATATPFQELTLAAGQTALPGCRPVGPQCEPGKGGHRDDT